MFLPRSYQQRAFDAAIAQLKKSADPIIIDAAPASGKSFLVAMLAKWFFEVSGGKRVLALAPNSSLIKQNVEKYLLTGEKCSIFSASSGQKSTKHPIVYGTPLTVKNSISRFKKNFCAVIVDEAHGLTPTIRTIIEEMRIDNPNLRVVGLTGTPYVLGSGYIFREWPDGDLNGEDSCRDPYFTKCVYRVTAKEMLNERFITPMKIGAINEQAYDTSSLEILPNGTPSADSIERAFVGMGRKTSAIVADVLRQAQGRPGGVMFFAATVRHAEEILASLPPENSALSTGVKYVLFGKDSTEDAVVKAYRQQRVRYLVNVQKHTTGFDVSHTSVIALLRYTESAALLQQIMGRAWRLDDAKDEALLLDYAENIERHHPDGDIYNPEIKAKGAKTEGEGIECLCEQCGFANQFKINPDFKDYQYDGAGYALDVFGARINTEHGPMAVHYGRRCLGFVKDEKEYVRCNYYWTSKICEVCNSPNDISARYCNCCKSELVDPNDRLISEFRALKRDPSLPQTDNILSMESKESISQSGNPTIRVDVVTEFRQFSFWIMKNPKNARHQADLDRYKNALKDGQPKTISYVKEGSGFYRALAYNAPADEAPEGFEMKKKVMT